MNAPPHPPSETLTPHPASTPRRGHRLSPLGRWVDFRSRPRPATLPPPILTLARPRRLHRFARAALCWSVAFYVLAALGLNLVMDRWCPAAGTPKL